MPETLKHIQTQIEWLLMHRPVVTAATAMAWGLLWCFVGYRLFRAMMVLTGVLGGAVLGYGIGMAFGTHYSLGVIGALLGALVGGVALWAIVHVFVFLLGMGICGGITWIILGELAGAPGRTVLLGVTVAGLAGGVLALVWMRAVLSVYTALGGAGTVVLAVALLVVGIPKADSAPALEKELMRSLDHFFGQWGYYALAGWVILAAVGAAVQLYTPMPRSKQHEHKAETPESD